VEKNSLAALKMDGSGFSLTIVSAVLESASSQNTSEPTTDGEEDAETAG